MNSLLERIIRLRWWILIFLAIIAFTIFAGDFRLDPTTAILAATLRHSTPLVLGALCGMLCECLCTGQGFVDEVPFHKINPTNDSASRKKKGKLRMCEIPTNLVKSRHKSG